jgi:hypothetical protein
VESLKVLQDFCDEGTGDIVGKAVEGGLVFLEKAGGRLAHLILFPEDEGRICINDFLAV